MYLPGYLSSIASKSLLDVRQWASIVREVSSIEYLDACMLFAIEWSNDWSCLTRLTSLLEG
jgi:hypothetical protein